MRPLGMLLAATFGALVAAAPGRTPAQGPPALTKGGGDEVQPPPGKPQRLERTVGLVGASVPALKYELLPPGRDRVSGNAALGYLKAASLRPEPPRDADGRRKLGEQALAFEEAALDKLPVKELAAFLRPHRPTLRALDEAARLEVCAWQQHSGGADDVTVDLSFVQGTREMTRLLRHRARLEILEGRPADAVRTVQTAFQYAKHTGEAGGAIPLLVALSNATVSLATAEELTTRPGAPNLYWAMTTLPQPLIDPRPALEGESRLALAFLPQLKEMEAGPVTAEKADKALDDALKLLAAYTADGADAEARSLLSKVGTAAAVALQGPAARKDLAARGWAAADLDKMPNAQAVVLRAAAIHQEQWDEQVKLFYRPYPRAAEEAEGVRLRLEQLRKTYRADPLIVGLSPLYPTLTRVRYQVARTERRFALFRACEAVRLHAATHSGQLPTTLAEVGVAVPDDPMTGKPFGYEPTAAGYRLEASPPPGETPHAGNALTLEVTIKR